MKTTNFFIDFIIVGLIGIGAILVPIFMLDHGLLAILLQNTDIIIKLTPVITIVTYVFGVVFNQFSDRVDDLLHSFRWLKDIKTERQRFKNDFGKSDHDCIQYIVIKSTSAYEYLSYRRSVIRIIRALLTMSLIILILHPVSSAIASIFIDLRWSLSNMVIMITLSALLSFLVYTLRKIELGYFAAVRNFYISISNESQPSSERKPTDQ